MQRTRSWRRHQNNRIIMNRLKQINHMDSTLAEQYKDRHNELSKKSPFGCGNSKYAIQKKTMKMAIIEIIITKEIILIF